MTNDELRIAIVEACPTLFEIIPGSQNVLRTVKGGMYVDPLNDLNVCHEFEMAALKDDPDFDRRYDRELARVTHGMNIPTVCGEPSFYVALLRRATARQRCEAFLKTKGLWKE